MVAVMAMVGTTVSGQSLVDHPIAGDSVTYLDGSDWVVSAPGLPTLPATVPGDLLSDLYNAGVIPEP